MGNYFDGTRRGRRRDAAVAGGFLLVAVFLLLLPASYQAPLRSAIRGTALRPFLAMQAELTERRVRREDVSQLRAERDSLAAVVAAQASLAEENRRLRALLGLRGRAQPEFRPAELIRAGVPGAESTFFIDIGAKDGVVVGSPVLAPGGLLGVITEVDEHTAQGIDWTHPNFRASAMTSDGDVTGIVEPRRGRFQEEDLLTLTSAPFHTDVRPGTRVVTTGRGGIYPRGIPLGTVVGIDEADTGWRKSYLLRPAVRPEGVTHVIVAIQREGQGGDLSPLWQPDEPADTGRAAAEPGAGEQRP